MRREKMRERKGKEKRRKKRGIVLHMEGEKRRDLREDGALPGEDEQNDKGWVGGGRE